MCITKIFGLFAVIKKLTTMKSLTNKEEEIMNHYWDNGEMQIRQLQALYDDPKPHVNTLSTLVHILEDKGFLSHRNLKTRTYAYFPKISREGYKRGSLNNVVNKFFGKSYLGVVSTLVSDEKISLDELKELIKKVEENKKMRKILLAVLFVFCVSVNTFADGKLPRYLIDGCFFNELPSGMSNENRMTITLSDQDGNHIWAIKGVKLTDEQKRKAVKKEDVPNADFWIKLAKDREWLIEMNKANSMSKKHNIAEGDTIGQFSVKDVDGHVWDNASTKGHALVLNFWYIGCGPCIKEMPEISKWKDECPDVNFLAVTYNSFDEIKNIVKRQNFSFTQIVDNKTLWEMFNVFQTPTTILIDKDGVVRKVTIGTNDYKRQEMLKAIKEVSAAR